MTQEQVNFPKTPQRRWLMVLRLVISTFLLLSLSLLKSHGDPLHLSRDWFEPGLAALGFYYLLAIIYYYLPAGGRAASFNTAAQVLADLSLAICLTLITGGGDSPFSFLFIIVIINGSFLGGIRTALVVATFSAALWGAMITLQDSGHLSQWMPDLGLASYYLSGYNSGDISARLIRILINTGFCYLVAFLSGHLAGQLFISRTALVQSQAHLDHLANLNENIIQSIDSGLITMDHNGLILTVNRAGLEMLGRRLDEMRGRPWQLFLPELEPVMPHSARTRTLIYDSGGLRFEHLREADGRELVLELTLLALSDSDGEIWGRLFVLKDLTSLSKMEETVRKAEHLAGLGELAAGLAHELRTPLASMTGACHMLSEQSLDLEDQKRLINIIGREMERLAKLTSDFLSFARPAVANPRVFDLPSLISDQLKLCRHAKMEGVTVESDLKPTPPVFFDQDQCVQVFWNLLRNAVEAGEKRAEFKIIVETGLDPVWPDHVALKVSDTGPGIPHENMQKLFEPFFTTKTTGNGLGLATVSRILHAGNGHITVASAHRGLTTFSAYFPQPPMVSAKAGRARK